MATARDLASGAVLGMGAPLTGFWLASVAVDLLRDIAAPGPAAPEDVLTLVVALGGLGVATWLWLGLLLALLGHLPGRVGDWCREIAERTTPAVVRRCAAVVVGAGLAGALAPGTATADGRTADTPAAVALNPSFAPTVPYAAAVPVAHGPSPAFAPTTGAEQGPDRTAPPAPGWTPSRPPVRSQPSTALLSTAPAPDEQAGTVVRRGDTLWGIVRAHLGPDATDAEVAAEWPRWHEANRAVIGADPDRLLPGQVLHAPAAVGALR